MMENVGMAEEKREKEIPLALIVLDKELQEQDAAIINLREALGMVLGDDERPIAIEETARVVAPEITKLGGQLKAYQARITNNTRAIRQMIRDLEI